VGLTLRAPPRRATVCNIRQVFSAGFPRGRLRESDQGLRGPLKRRDRAAGRHFDCPRIALGAMKHAYSFCGFALESDLPLPELDAAPELGVGHDQTIAVELCQPKTEISRPTTWFLRQNLPNGASWSARARTAEGYFLHFDELADFIVDRSGCRIRCVWRHPEVSDLTLRAVLLDHVIAPALTLRGHYVLHAAAAMTPGGVCGFVGHSGAGKSTIVASLAPRNEFLTDDCLVIDENDGKYLARPSHPNVKLRADSIEFLNPIGPGEPVADYTTKQRIQVSALGASSPPNHLPLSRLYFLRRDQKEERGLRRPTVERLPKRAAFLKLVHHGIRLDPTDRAMLQREFEFVRRLVGAVPAAELFLPNDFSALHLIDETLAADLVIS
jgi:hypothetical protein